MAYTDFVLELKKLGIKIIDFCRDNGISRQAIHDYAKKHGFVQYYLVKKIKKLKHSA